MSIGWVAGAVRGKALARRCLGTEATADLAAQETLSGALHLLADSTYGHRMKSGMDLESAQQAVSETALWHLRVLAGWLPPRGVGVARALAAWFEASDLAELAVSISAGRVRPPASLPLGTLAIAWTRATDAPSLPELRSVLARSEWGDPGGDSLEDILLGLRLGWARLLSRTFHGHPEWGAGALAVTTAAARFLGSGEEEPDPDRVPELGTWWASVPDIPTFVSRLPSEARWALLDVDGPDALWQAERRWWTRLEADASALAGGRALGRPTVVGSAATLLVDCWRVRTALAAAHRGPATAEESDEQG